MIRHWPRRRQGLRQTALRRRTPLRPIGLGISRKAGRALLRQNAKVNRMIDRANSPLCRRTSR